MCQDFDLCASCYEDRERLHDAAHSFYRIQYRRLDVPPIWGEDLELMRRFHEDDSAESFYLHYPWIFNPSTFEKLVVGTVDEETHRKHLKAAVEGLDPDDAELFLDQYIRMCACAHWNYQSLRNEVKDLVDIQLLRAEASQYFASTWKGLANDLVDPGSTSSTQRTEIQKRLLQHQMGPAEFCNIADAFRTHCAQREEEWEAKVSGCTTENQSARSRYFRLIALESKVSQFSRQVCSF
jgi:hypothetical protein